MNSLSGQKSSKRRNAALLFLATAIGLLGSTLAASACTRTSTADYVKASTWYSDLSVKIGEVCVLSYRADLNAGITGMNIIDTRASDGVSIETKKLADGGTSFIIKGKTEGLYDVSILLQSVVANANYGGGRGPQVNWQGFMVRVTK